MTSSLLNTLSKRTEVLLHSAVEFTEPSLETYRGPVTQPRRVQFHCIGSICVTVTPIDGTVNGWGVGSTSLFLIVVLQCKSKLKLILNQLLNTVLFPMNSRESIFFDEKFETELLESHID